MTWWPLHSWHPVMVHLPLIGLLLAVAFDLLAAQTRSPRWRDLATILWWLGIIGLGSALATGLIAYGRVEHSDLAHEAMTLHRNTALAAAALLLGTALWRWRRPYARGAALVGLLGALGLTGVGYLGGELVYRHGLGISNAVLQEIAHERAGELHNRTKHDQTAPPMEHHHD